MSTATEVGPTGVDLTWPRTTSGKGSRWRLAQWAAIAGATMIGVDPVVNSFVLPTASKQLDMATSMIALASSLATLILTAGLLGAGALGDRIGRRRVLVIGAWITLIGEIVTTCSVGSGMYILGRAIVGIGMAGLFGMAIGLIPAVTTPEQLPKTYGKMFACTALGGLLGVLGSGVLVAIGGWRLGFSINVLCMAVVVALAMYSVPENKSAQYRPFDYQGVILAAAALLLFMFGLGQTVAWGWTNPLVLVLIFGGIALFVAFVWVERRSAHPSFPMQILKIPTVVAAVIALVAAGLAQGSVQANLVELMQTAGGYSPTVVSLVAIPMVVFGVISALLTGTMISRGSSPRLVLTLLMVTLLLGVGLCVLITPALSLIIAPIALALTGFGMQGTYGTGATLIMRAAPADMLGSVGTVKPVMGQLGYGLGLGAIVPIIATFTHTAESNGTAPQQAAYHGFSVGMLVVLILEIVAMIAVLAVLRAAQKKAAATDGQLDPMLPPDDGNPTRRAGEYESWADSEVP